MHDVIVVGGGVVGLSIAREAAMRGRSALVLDRAAPGEGASWAAAGMLAPQSEAEEDGDLFRFGLASLGMYRAWSDCIREETGVDPEYRESGLLFLAETPAELDALNARAKWQVSKGLPVERVSPAQVAEIESAITLPSIGALLMPGEHQVTPRRLLKGLMAACANRRVEVRAGQRVDALVVSADGRAEGVRVGSERIRGGQIVVAAGVWSSEIAGLRPMIPVRPRKGQILSLAMPGPAFTRMIRWRNRYVVPRRDGDLIVGATTEDVGFDRRLTSGGIGGILADAQQLSAQAASYPIIDMWSGLRPSAPDGLPVLGRSDVDGVIYAAGHYRNGVLLAPITASTVVDLLDGRTPAVAIDGFRPGRFAV